MKISKNKHSLTLKVVVLQNNNKMYGRMAIGF